MGILQDLTGVLLDGQIALMKANSAGEFAAAVRETADKLTEASAEWAEMSATIRIARVLLIVLPYTGR